MHIFGPPEFQELHIRMEHFLADAGNSQKDPIVGPAGVKSQAVQST